MGIRSGVRGRMVGICGVHEQTVGGTGGWGLEMYSHGKKEGSRHGSGVSIESAVGVL